KSLLQVTKPSLLAVENEMDHDGSTQTKAQYTGTAQDYLAELKAACEVSHELGIPCMDGGISSAGMLPAIADYYLQNGRTSDAMRFARYFPGRLGGRDVSSASELGDALTAQNVERSRQILQGIKAQGA